MKRNSLYTAVAITALMAGMIGCAEERNTAANRSTAPGVEQETAAQPGAAERNRAMLNNEENRGATPAPGTALENNEADTAGSM